jgi:HAD superfamily hydrolase (TIGR01549 family)
MHVEYSYLVKLVAEWMYKRPLKYLPFIGSHKARKNIQLLRNNGIAVFFYSDYPLFNKMKKLNYDFETSAYWSSLDIEISAFKPNPKFLYHFQTLHGFTKEEILFVGDRLERDKALADNFGCSFLHIGEFKRDCTKNFDAVKNHTQ